MPTTTSSTTSSIPKDVQDQLDKITENISFMPEIETPLDPVKTMEEICKEVAKKQRYEQEIFRKRVALMLRNKGVPTAVLNIPVGYDLNKPYQLQQGSFPGSIVGA